MIVSTRNVPLYTSNYQYKVHDTLASSEPLKYHESFHADVRPSIFPYHLLHSIDIYLLRFGIFMIKIDCRASALSV